MMAHESFLTDQSEGEQQLALLPEDASSQEHQAAGELKFLGIVKSYNDQKAFGMIECNEAGVMWQQDIYVYKDVLVSAGAGVGDTVRFGIHISPKGQPQASLPLYKVGDDGEIEGEIKDKDRERLPYWQHVEDMGLSSPEDYDRIKHMVEQRSAQQNSKAGSGPKAQMKRVANFGWGNEVSLYVSGVPPEVSRRELAHIFRQYQGYMSLRTVPKEDHTLTFVSFSSYEEADYAAMSLNGYIFDEDIPPEHQAPLVLHVAKGKGKSKQDGKGQCKMSWWAPSDPYTGKAGGWQADGYGNGSYGKNSYSKDSYGKDGHGKGGGSGMLQHGAPIGFTKGKGGGGVGGEYAV